MRTGKLLRYALIAEKFDVIVKRRNSMSQQIVPERVIGIGILSGMVAGLITGTGARIAMRIVALSAHRSPIFTVGGTFSILFITTN